MMSPRRLTDGGESLQDDSYAFDEENTDSDEYYDTEDTETGELDFELDEDRLDEIRREEDYH